MPVDAFAGHSPKLVCECVGLLRHCRCHVATRVAVHGVSSLQVRRVMIRRLKKDVLKQLPPKRRQVRE